MTIRNILIAATLLTLSFQQSFAQNDAAGSGTVSETIWVDNYVYVHVAESDSWIAASPAEVNVGDRIHYSGGAPMKDFYSRTLDRTFGDILFVTDLTVVEAAPQDAEALIEHAHQTTGKSAAAPPKPGDIAPVEGGMTVAEIYANYRQLQNQSVSVRGRVTKVNPKIMGKNWITLQDGTGTAPDDKLIATTEQLVNVGDEVTARGSIKTDVSLGTGYDYKVLLEDASFSP